MPGDSFVDTNIFVYAADNKEPLKQIRARELNQSLRSIGSGVVSYQVIQEYINVSLQKSYSLSTPELTIEEVKRTFAGYRIVWPTANCTKKLLVFRHVTGSQ